MILQSTANDTISIDLAKQHLYVDHNLDNILIQAYIDASRGIVEDYMHSTVLQREYSASLEELIPTEVGLMLYLEEDPFFVEITSNLGVEVLDKRYYTYDYDYILIPAVEDRTITAVTAKTGKVSQQAQILQARLLLIGSAYAYRENSVALRMSQVPDGVRFILDNCSEVSL